MPPESDDRLQNPGDIDEAKWKHAKELAKAEYGKGHWAAVSAIYEKMGGQFHHKNDADAKKNVPGKVDEPKWEEAKKLVEKEHGDTEDHYALVVRAYKAAGGHFHENDSADSKQNGATGPATRWFALHFFPGVANYPESDEMVYISPEVAKEMDPTFEGKALTVEHVDSVDYSKAAGRVVKSFYNPLDGCCWAEILAETDEAKEAIRKGWKVSNSYNILASGPAGLQVATPYNRSIKKACYDHLALVPRPRYTQSIVLSPQEFKDYNANKEAELKKLSNSAPAEKPRSISMLFDWFKRVKNESVDETSCVILPKSKVEKTLTQLVNAADEAEEKAKLPKIADNDHLMAYNGETYTVEDFKKKHDDCMNALAKEMTAHAETKNAFEMFKKEAPAKDETEDGDKDKDKGKEARAKDKEEPAKDKDGDKDKESAKDKEKEEPKKDDAEESEKKKSDDDDADGEDKAKAEKDKEEDMKKKNADAKAKADADAKAKADADKAKETFEKQKHAESIHNHDIQVKNVAPIGTTAAWELGKKRY